MKYNVSVIIIPSLEIMVTFGFQAHQLTTWGRPLLTIKVMNALAESVLIFRDLWESKGSV